MSIFNKHEGIMKSLETLQLMEMHNQILLLHLLESATDMSKEDVVALNETITKEISENFNH